MKRVKAACICQTLHFIFPKQLITLFGAANESNYYTDFAMKAFRIYLCMMILACVNKACFIFLQAMRKAVASTMLSIVREIVSRADLPPIPRLHHIHFPLEIFRRVDILYDFSISGHKNSRLILALKTNRLCKIQYLFHSLMLQYPAFFEPIRSISLSESDFIIFCT